MSNVGSAISRTLIPVAAAFRPPAMLRWTRLQDAATTDSGVCRPGRRVTASEVERVESVHQIVEFVARLIRSVRLALG